MANQICSKSSVTVPTLLHVPVLPRNWKVNTFGGNIYFDGVGTVKVVASVIVPTLLQNAAISAQTNDGP